MCASGRLEEESTGAKQALREREQHLAQVRHLTAEVSDLTAEKAAADSKRQHVSRDADTRISAAQAARLQADHACDTAVQRAQCLEDEVRQLDASNKRLAERASRSQEQLAQQAAQLTAERAAHEDEVRTLESAIAAAERATEEKVAHEQRDASASKRQLEDQLAAVTSEAEMLRSDVCHVPNSSA